MNYYRDPITGEVFAYEADGSQDDHVRSGLALMSAQEIYDHLHPALVPLSRDQVEQMRLTAYADPISGSDRYFAEAARLAAMGGAAEEIEAIRTAGAGRYAEIQEAFPWP